MSYNESAREPDLDSWDLMVMAACEEWQQAVSAYEDGLSDVEPGTFEDWF